MTYREALDYIEDSKQYGSVLGLESIRELCRRLGNPQDKLKFIHIAGTNGKGSTLAFISTVLTNAGIKTGRYSSPAVFQYEEIIQVDGKPIGKAALGKVITGVANAADAMQQDGLPHPTTFEMETAAAFLYFVQKQCEIVVLETGMGGNLDATNIITSVLISVLTSISMDHMKFLGNTLGEIAEKKAGIIKPGAKVVSIRQPDEAMQVIQNTAKSMGCEVVIAEEAEATDMKREFPCQTFSYKGERYKINLAGVYQIKNAVLAIEVLMCLKKLGFPIETKQIKEGLKKADWNGRLSILQKKPLLLADGAHNVEAAELLAKSLEVYFTNRRIIYIMGMLKDKEYERVAEIMASYASDIITVTPPWPERALSAYELAKTVSRYHNRVTAADSMEEAVEMSRLLADSDSVILAFGSLSYLGELWQSLQK